MTTQLELPNQEGRYSYLFFEPFMRDLVDEACRLMGTQVRSKRYDFDNNDLSEHPFDAWEINAFNWSDRLGEAYSRRSLKSADEVNELSGAEGSWRIVCRDVGSPGYVEYTYGGNPRQKVGVELFIAPPPEIAADAILLSELAKIARSGIVPYWLELIAVHIIAVIPTEVFYYAVIEPKIYRYIRAESV